MVGAIIDPVFFGDCANTALNRFFLITPRLLRSLHSLAMTLLLIKEFLLPLNNTKLSSSSHRIETNKPIILSPRKVITLYINEQHQT